LDGGLWFSDRAGNNSVHRDVEIARPKALD
jgi:hypothetical protein